MKRPMPQYADMFETSDKKQAPPFVLVDIPKTQVLKSLAALATVVALSMGLAPAIAAPATPDPALLAAAQRAEPELIDTLRQMVLIESGSQHVPGLLRMADLVEARLKGLGFATQRRKAVPGPGADIVLGTREGTGQKTILLMAHLDTVYPVGTLQTQPYKREGQRLYGPGIADDKGGVATILHGLQILAEQGWRDFRTLTVLFNPDEEIGSPGSKDLITQTADAHEVVLSFEPTGTRQQLGESLVLGASGANTITLEVKGRASHAGVSPDLGRNAVIELSHQLVQSRDIARAIPGAQLNWTQVVANGPRNQIPATAVAHADVRSTVPGSDQQVAEALRAKVASSRLVPDTETTVKLGEGRPAFRATPAAYTLAEKGQTIYGELGRTLNLVPMIGGATDAAYAGRSGKATVVESLGLPGAGYHARDEYIDIDGIVPRLYLMTRLLQEVVKP